MAQSRDPDDLVRRAGRGDPDRDQHFLIDDRVLDRIPTYAEDLDTEHVLEIGPGPGALTDRLLRVASTVTAVERDPSFVAFLREEFTPAIAEGRLRVLQGDALDVALPGYTASISNLPYGVSTPVTFRLLRERKPAVSMYQREVAERMAAAPGSAEYGRLSVATQHFATVELVEPVPPEAFDPQPPVDSTIVRLTPRDPEYAVPDEAAFLDLVKAMFTQRRKTARNAIRNTAHISGIENPDALVDALDDSILSKRPDALAPSDFATIARVAESST
ncbi:MAG: 16S rRNA (adenine(1518)-N(6)/adenine(1519)-N(6))-dimethyltransferase RsmA [Halanaeroarchaeum sp.]